MLVVKNALCIAGEIVGVTGACMIQQALKDLPVAPGAAVPMAVSVVSNTAGAEAV